MEHQKERSRKPAVIYGGILAAAGLLMIFTLAAQGDGTLSLWETGFNSLLVVLGLAAMLCPAVRLTEESVPEVWVRESRFISWLGGIFFVIGLPFCVGAGLFLGDDAEGRAVCGALGLLCAAAGIWMELAYRNRGIAAYGNGNVTAVTSFGRCRTFSHQEIREVSLSLSGSLCARNADKKALFRFENNMDGAEELIGWLVCRGIEITMLQTEKKAENTGGESADRTQEWEEEESRPIHKYIRAIRTGTVIAALLAAAGSSLPLFFPEVLGLKKSILIMAFSPLLLYLCYVLFPGIVVAEKPEQAGKKWKERHICIPGWIPCLLGLWNLEVFRQYETIVLQVVDSGKMAGLDLIFMAVLIGFVVLRTPKKLRKSGLVWLVLFTMCISWGISYGTNLALCGKPEHFEAQITDADRREEDGDPEYYLTVKIDGQTQTELYVSEDMYAMYEAGDPLTLCLRNNIFGIRMADLHLPEEK